MSDAIIVALITGLCSVLGSYLAIRKKSRDDDIKAAMREQRQEDKFEDIEEWMKRVDKKLDEHNGYAQKFADTAKSIAVIENTLAIQKKRGGA